MNLRLPSNERFSYYAIMLLGLIAILMLSSCSTTKEIRRANRASKKLDRLVERFPELMQRDTIRDTINVLIPDVKFDTVVLKADTINLIKEHWRVQIITKTDSVYVSGGCDTVTVYIPIQIPVNRIQPIEYKPMPLKWWMILLMGLGGLFILQQILNAIASRLP